MRIGQNPDALRKAMETAAQQPLESLDDAGKAGALQKVAADLGVKPVELLNTLEQVFPDVFAQAPQPSLAQLGAAAEYQAAAGAISQQGRVAGTRIAAMTGGATYGMDTIQDFMTADSADAIKDKAGKLPEMMNAYAGVTAQQLCDELRIPPRVQSVLREQLSTVAKNTVGHFGKAGFDVEDGPINAFAINQHAGYVAGELSRSHGLDPAKTRAALNDYYGGDGDLDAFMVAELERVATEREGGTA